MCERDTHQVYLDIHWRNDITYISHNLFNEDFSCTLGNQIQGRGWERREYALKLSNKQGFNQSTYLLPIYRLHWLSHWCHLQVRHMPVLRPFASHLSIWEYKSIIYFTLINTHPKISGLCWGWLTLSYWETDSRAFSYITCRSQQRIKCLTTKQSHT